MKKQTPFNYPVYVAWLIALTGFLLSLYYSERMGIEPCNLCWWQRSALLPLTIILGIAAFRADGSVAIYAWPFCLLGFVVAIAQLGWYCVKCTAHVPLLWGNVPLSWLSTVGFIAIAAALRLGFKKTR